MRYPGFSSSALAARTRSRLATCFRNGGILVASALAIVVFGFPTPAQAKPAPCQGGRYVLKDKLQALIDAGALTLRRRQQS